MKAWTGQGQATRLVGSGVDVAEGDAVVFEPFDALVGEGDAVHVAGEVGGGMIAVAGVLEMDGPGFAPEEGVEIVVEAGEVKRVADLGAEDLRESEAWEEEAGVCGLDPGGPIARESAGGEEEMGVGMEGEGARPGVEHSENAQAATDPLAVVGELLDSGCGLSQEDGIGEVLMGASEPAQFGRQGEGEQIVGAGQEAGAQLLEPASGLVLVTLGAVSVAAGVVGVVEGRTVATAKQRAAQRGCSAPDDVVHGAQVRWQDATCEGFSVRRSGAAENVRELDHGGSRAGSGPLHQAMDGI